MSKSLYIAEKPSVAREFANALKVSGRANDGYIESENAVVTWCVGHLVTMSYPEAYDIKYKRWSLQTLPFLPKEFKYQVIENVEKQFKIVSGLLNRDDVDTIYVCTDSGREGISTASWRRWPELRARNRNGSGLTRRRKKKYCAESGRQRICPSMTTWRPRPI